MKDLSTLKKDKKPPFLGSLATSVITQNINPTALLAMIFEGLL